MIQNITMFGPRELALIFELEKRENTVFSFAEAAKIIGGPLASVANILKRLKRKRRISTLQRGLYLYAPLKSGFDGNWSEDAFAVVPSLVKSRDYYIGFVSAMNYWGMTEQLPVRVLVALKRQKSSLDAVGARFVFIKKPRLGTTTSIKVSGREVLISTREQTIIDGLLFPEKCLGIAGMANAIDSSSRELGWEKLLELARAEKEVVRRRLGYILELLGRNGIAKQLEGKYAGFAWLDPSSSKTVLRYSKKWGLKLNLSEKQLLEFREVH